MEPEVLSWDNASNNRFLLSGKGSWIHNPISPYCRRRREEAADRRRDQSPQQSGWSWRDPLGDRVNSLGIWKFSKNIALARDFIKFLFQKENYNAFIAAGSAFNQPPVKHFGEHPIWASNPKYAMLPREAE